MASIGFIGLGKMGLPMVQNLSKSGNFIKVYDSSPEIMANLGKLPVTKAKDLIEVVKGVEYVISMLPDTKTVSDTYFDQAGLLHHISEGSTVVDCSTIAPETAKLLAEKAKDRNILMLDAPVTGGVNNAVKGDLAFIVGGERKIVEKARPLLMHMGSFVIFAGENGAGQMAKICNNMLLAIQMVGTAEVLQLGVDNGLDPKTLSDIMLRSSGKNWVLENYNPYPGVMNEVPAANNYETRVSVDMLSNDLNLVIEAALVSESLAPMGTLARSLFERHRKEGNGNLDFSSIQKRFLEHHASIQEDKENSE